MSYSPEQVLMVAAMNAAQAANAQWERDGKVDCGSCGGAMLQFDKRSKLAKAAVAGGYAHNGSEVFLLVNLPEGIRTQHAAVYQAYARAFRDELASLGYSKAIKKFWTYVD